MTCPTLRLALTPGEPAGIGPDLVVQIAQQPWPHQRIAIADPDLLKQRARQLNLPLELLEYDQTEPPVPDRAGMLRVAPVRLSVPVVAGHLDLSNAQYVLECLKYAASGCLCGEFSAMVTGPVHKGIINEAGLPFTGHTEFLADLTASRQVVMMLATPGLRVALTTTHLPLCEVPRAITRDTLSETLRILNQELRNHFGITKPHILVLGLNPHAGEGGYLGREEIDVIIPVIEALRAEGLDLTGPVPADTAFQPEYLKKVDAVLAMYHDQGLPVLKHLGFGQAVNITLGLPIIRTSVDHGTALELAGTGHGNPGSLNAALDTASNMAINAGNKMKPVSV